MPRVAPFIFLLVFACGEGPEVRRDVAYDARFGAATTVDLYLPRDSKSARPAVMVIHGDGWNGYSKDELAHTAERLAERGYVVGAINYRLVPDGRFPASPQDARCALAFLRAHADDYRLDPQRVAVFGYSAGGHIASLLGVASDSPDLQSDCAAGPTGPPQAVISGAGVQDMRSLGWAPQVRDFLGGAPEDLPDVYSRASPLDHVDPGEPPFLFIHGTQDVQVPLEHSQRMLERLRAAGNQAELLALAGGGHTMNPGTGTGQLSWSSFVTDTPEAWAAMLDFLGRTVGAP